MRYSSNKYNLVDEYTTKRVAETHNEWWRGERYKVENRLPFFDGDEHDLARSFEDVQRNDVKIEGKYSEVYLVRIKGKYFWSQDLVELRYITHSSENTFTEHIGIKLDGKLYEYGIGNHKHEYYSDCGCVFSRCLRNCHADEIYVLRKLHTIFNIDYDQTAAMIHLLFGCWSNYNSECGHPYIKDSIQSLEKLIEMWE